MYTSGTQVVDVCFFSLRCPQVSEKQLGEVNLVFTQNGEKQDCPPLLGLYTPPPLPITTITASEPRQLPPLPPAVPESIWWDFFVELPATLPFPTWGKFLEWGLKLRREEKEEEINRVEVRQAQMPPPATVDSQELVDSRERLP